jgi:hypothetical protein
MKKYFLNGFAVANSGLIKALTTCKYFAIKETKEDFYGNQYIHYEFTGYRMPLLCYISDNLALIHSPYGYSGSYTYNGEDVLTLHSTYGRMETYRKINIFGVPFMVNSNLNDEDVVLAAETDPYFTRSLIKAL